MCVCWRDDGTKRKFMEEVVRVCVCVCVCVDVQGRWTDILREEICREKRIKKNKKKNSTNAGLV